jgi:uncharacterized membrane protein YccC
MEDILANIKHWQSTLLGIATTAAGTAKLLGYDIVITQEMLLPGAVIAAGLGMIFGFGKKKETPK